MTVMDFPTSPTNGQTTTDGRYYFDSSVGSTGAWRSTPLPVGGLPAGSIMAWGTNTPPANWLIADGSAVSRETYSSLFAVIGTQYGAGNGTTTFNLPDLRGRVPVGRNGGTFGTLGATGGAETQTLTEAQLPPHRHKVRTNTTAASVYSSTPNSTTQDLDANEGTVLNVFWSGSTAHGLRGTGSIGSGEAHNNLQPYQVVNYIIKASAGWTAGDSELATRVGQLEQPGRVLQVASATRNTIFSTTSSTYVDVTGVSVTITPRSATSKVLVTVNTVGSASNNSVGLGLGVYRNSTLIGTNPNGQFSLVHYPAATGVSSGLSFQYLDAPATVASTTYKLSLASLTAGTNVGIGGYLANAAAGVSTITTITVMEVAA